MAGSLNHIVDKNGAMSFSTLEPGKDRTEALMECFDLIAELAGDKATLDKACKKLGFPIPKAMPRVGARAWETSEY